MSASPTEGVGKRLNPRIRKLVVWLHRWVGLAMAVFLVIEGLTGAMLAFRGPLTRVFDPALFAAPPSPGAPPLDLATLIERAERLEPRARFQWFLPLDVDGVALVGMVPRDTHGPRLPGFDADFGYLALDPWTGTLIRRVSGGLYSHGVLANVMPFVYDLHKTLAVGEAGAWVLALVALLWTLDCFGGLYLTLPLAMARFWQRWKPAWAIKWRARWPRVNHDLHQASSLWLWAVLLIFAWSSVALVDKFSVYEHVMGGLLGPSSYDEARPAPVKAKGPPTLDWHAALARGGQLAAEIAAREHFALRESNSLWYLAENREYMIRFRTDRLFPTDRDLIFNFDADSGALRERHGSNSGTPSDVALAWLVSFHMITDPFEYTAFRAAIVVVGLLLAAISITGVIVWWHKHRARTRARLHRTQLARPDAADASLKALP